MKFAMVLLLVAIIMVVSFTGGVAAADEPAPSPVSDATHVFMPAAAFFTSLAAAAAASAFGLLL